MSTDKHDYHLKIGRAASGAWSIFCEIGHNFLAYGANGKEKNGEPYQLATVGAVDYEMDRETWIIGNNDQRIVSSQAVAGSVNYWLKQHGRELRAVDRTMIHTLATGAGVPGGQNE